MKLVYINSGRSSVFDSQVLALLKYYKENNIFEEVILLFGYRKQDDIDWLEAKETVGILIYYFKTFPNYPIYNQKICKNLYQAIRNLAEEFSNHFFHIRGDMTAYHLKNIIHKLGISNKQLLTDIRGANLEEVKQYSRLDNLLKWYKLRNYKIALNYLKRDVSISVVSNTLKEYLISEYSVAASSLHINSCIVAPFFKYNPESRIALRQALSLNDSEILIVFASGGTANWQKNDMLIQLAESGFKVLNLSKIAINHSNVFNQFVQYEKVPDYLSAADVAFIWRDKSIVNQVASPVKFSEYMACGLPVIHNGTVALIDKITDQYSIGMRILNLNEINQAKVSALIKKTSREEISTIGNTLFGLANMSKSYNHIYSNARQ